MLLFGMRYIWIGGAKSDLTPWLESTKVEASIFYNYDELKDCLLLDHRVDWKDTVKGRHLLDRNWRTGQCYSSTLRGHR